MSVREREETFGGEMEPQLRVTRDKQKTVGLLFKCASRPAKGLVISQSEPTVTCERPDVIKASDSEPTRLEILS